MVAGPDGTRGAATSSMVAMFEEQARRGAARVAVRQKRGGAWEDVTWAELARRARDLSDGLAALGVRPGDRLAVLGDTHLEHDLLGRRDGKEVEHLVVGFAPACARATDVSTGDIDRAIGRHPFSGPVVGDVSPRAWRQPVVPSQVLPQAPDVVEELRLFLKRKSKRFSVFG